MTLAVLVAATPSGVLLMGIDVVVIAVPAAFGLLALHEGLEVFDARRDRAAARPESP